MNKTQTGLVVIYLIALLSSAGCATQQLSSNSDSPPKSASSSPSYDGKVVSLRDDEERHNIAHWEKARALYLYDLQMAALDRKFDRLSDPDYLLGEKLIQAGLKVAYAQADQLTLNDPQSALHELEDARSKLAVADNLAPPADKPSLAKVEHLLATARNSAASGHCKSTAAEARTYKNLHTQLDRLIQGVG